MRRFKDSLSGLLKHANDLPVALPATFAVIYSLGAIMPSWVLVGGGALLGAGALGKLAKRTK